MLMFYLTSYMFLLSLIPIDQMILLIGSAKEARGVLALGGGGQRELLQYRPHISPKAASEHKAPAKSCSMTWHSFKYWVCLRVN